MYEPYHFERLPLSFHFCFNIFLQPAVEQHTTAAGIQIQLDV